jgi:predicted  nucleic acid-binding Zn-ribbon protein
VQIYVLNRARETLATTSGIYDDKHTLTLDAGSSSYEFKISKNDEASQYMDSGNYIVLQDDDGKTWLFTILDYEETQYTKTVYAEDAGIELLNKACDIWKSSGPHSFEYYFNLVTSGTPWQLGVNQLAGLERTLKYEGRDTGLGRLLSILKGFDSAECTFDVTVKMNAPSEFKINVYKQVGSDRSDVQMAYSHELNDIVKKESRAEFVTALCGVGGTIQTTDAQGNTQDTGNIDFADLEYNKDGLVTTKGDKFLRAIDANKRFNPGQATYIEAFYEYDTQSASELLNRTITRLKTYSEPQYTYTADVKIIDSTLKIGDTVTIIDHDYNPALYLSARVAKLEKSYTDPSQNTIEFCNYQLLSSRLADKLAKLQTIVNKMPSASQVGKLESNVSDLSKKQDELASQITSANGKNTNFYGKAEPANPKNGDLWYKKLENGEIEMYQFQDGVWQLLASTADLTTVQTELDQAKTDMAQAKTDAQTAYDEAIKATNTANGAKAQTAEALEQVKQANSSYTALAKEVADNKTSVDADVADIRKAIDANKASADADWKQAQKDYASVSDKLTETNKTVTDIKTSVNGIKTTVADNTGKISTMSQTVDGVKTSVANAQGDIATIKTDVSGTKQTVANAQKDITSIKTSVSGVQTDITNAKKDITSVKTDISGVKTSVSNVQGDVTSLKTSVSGVQADVKNAKGDITSIKADVSGVKTTVSDHTGKITSISKTVDGLTTSVSNKVDKTTYQSYVAQTDKALSAKLTASDLKGYAKTADVKQTTDGLSASITKVQGNLAYQATELIGKKSFEDGNVGDWTCNDCKTKAVISGITPYSAYGYHKCIYAPNNNDLCWNVDYKVNPGDKYYVELLAPNFYSVHGGRTITVNAYFEYIKDGKNAWQMGPSGQVVTGTSGWIKGIVTVPANVTSVKPWISVKDNGVASAAYLTYASFTKLDEYTQSQLNTLSGKITATSDRLSSVYTKSETDAKLKTKVEQSALTQTSNNLSASIAKNSKILSSAGLVNENAYINANKIALNGKTLMTNATINDAFIGNVSANKITTGTLNAAKVNLINVNASNISTGTLSGVKITSTGKDPSGTSSTTTIQSGYIDTNVINCSDYILVGKADPDPRKRWQTKQDKWGMWFQTPAKLNGHTGNAPSDWQSEWQGFIRGDGWNYQTATVTGNGASGIAVAITPQQIWGRPYGGDYFQIGVWEPSYGADSVNGKKFENGWCSPRFVIDVTGQLTGHPHSITLGDTEDYTGTYNHGNLNILDGNLHVKPVYANHGIRTAWVSWSDWGSNQKIPCIVQDKDNWGGIAFPSNGRVVLFTHSYRINTDGLPRDKASVYNGWGS